MNSFTLNLNKNSLLELMKDFHLLTGIKIALFDIEGNEILSYPENHCEFCTLMHENITSSGYCLDSNRNSFERCRKTKAMEIFHCHAGLIETTAPLIENDAIIGYVMFGQITDNGDKSEVRNALQAVIDRYDLTGTGRNASIYDITYKNEEQIMAAAKILEACTFYVLLKDMVSLQRETFIQNLNEYLMSHLSEDLSVDRLTEEFHISRNRLYDSCNRYLQTGIAEHIKNLRIEEAKRLLSDTQMSVHDISDKVGFADYNYFCRVFKKVTGMPALTYRKNRAGHTV
ncbi:MAG: PocR ligand-binding domain-containing protein [Lachnospiraceae bacterium]|nr:PocR ligand-binding domain-containing protein [Candidatus Colinaster scatohippi]